jgi:hypothetical protein
MITIYYKDLSILSKEMYSVDNKKYYNRYCDPVNIKLIKEMFHDKNIAMLNLQNNNYCLNMVAEQILRNNVDRLEEE